jgi:putative oxidoreductase
VIVTLVYPASWVESLLWGSVLVTILTRGPGVISLDHLVDQWFERRSPSGLASRHITKAAG